MPPVISIGSRDFIPLETDEQKQLIVDAIAKKAFKDRDYSRDQVSLMSELKEIYDGKMLGCYPLIDYLDQLEDEDLPPLFCRNGFIYQQEVVIFLLPRIMEKLKEMKDVNSSYPTPPAPVPVVEAIEKPTGSSSSSSSSSSGYVPRSLRYSPSKVYMRTADYILDAFDPNVNPVNAFLCKTSTGFTIDNFIKWIKEMKIPRIDNMSFHHWDDNLFKVCMAEKFDSFVVRGIMKSFDPNNPGLMSRIEILRKKQAFGLLKEPATPLTYALYDTESCSDADVEEIEKPSTNNSSSSSSSSAPVDAAAARLKKREERRALKLRKIHEGVSSNKKRKLEIASPPPVIRKKKQKVAASRIDAVLVYLFNRDRKSGWNYQIPISELKDTEWEGYLNILSKCKIDHDFMQHAIDTHTREFFGCLDPSKICACGPTPRLYEIYEHFACTFDHYRVKDGSNVYSDDRSDCMKIIIADCKKYNFVDIIALTRP